MAANGLLDTIGETHTARNIRSASLQNKKSKKDFFWYKKDFYLN